MSAAQFEIITNREDFDRLVERLHDPDAERFRYFGAAMMDSVCNPDKPARQTRALMQIMELHKPRMLDELRTCIDAAKILVP